MYSSTRVSSTVQRGSNLAFLQTWTRTKRFFNEMVKLNGEVVLTPLEMLWDHLDEMIVGFLARGYYIFMLRVCGAWRQPR